MFCRNYVVPLKFVSMFIILSLCETLLRHVQQIKPSYTEAVCISLFFFYLTNLSEKTVMAREVERSTFCCGDQIFQVTMNKMKGLLFRVKGIEFVFLLKGKPNRRVERGHLMYFVVSFTHCVR